MSDDYKDMIGDYIKLVTVMMVRNGGVSPHLTVLGIDKTEHKNAVVYVPIESKHLASESSKDHFIDVVIPEIAKGVKEKVDVAAVIWAAEAWMRETKADSADALENWKDLPIKKEVLIMTVDAEDENTTRIYEIKRHGKQVNEFGNLVDNIELVELSEAKEGITAAEGRFTGLYKKFANTP